MFQSGVIKRSSGLTRTTTWIVFWHKIYILLAHAKGSLILGFHFPCTSQRQIQDKKKN